jgi:hypothetical protein
MKIIIIILALSILYILFSKNIINFTLEKCICDHLISEPVYSLNLNKSEEVFNPSIIKKDNLIICASRLSTLNLKNIFSFVYGSIFFKTFIIFLVIKDGKLKKIIYPECKSPNLKGKFEDPRLIEYKNNYFISATNYVNRNNIFPILLKFSKNFKFIKYIQYNKKDYFGKNKYTIQKNWCPFIHENNLFLHTDSYPLWKVYQIDENIGDMKNIINFDTSIFFKEYKKIYLRCSTSWKIYNKKYYICGLHTKDKGSVFPRIRSLLVLINRITLLPEKKTNLLCIEETEHSKIQYLSGIETDEQNIYISYGVNDCKLHIKKIKKKDLVFVT